MNFYMLDLKFKQLYTWVDREFEVKKLLGNDESSADYMYKRVIEIS